MLEKHVIHQNRGFGGCSIEIFTYESWIIVIFKVIGHAMLYIVLNMMYSVCVKI